MFKHFLDFFPTYEIYKDLTFTKYVPLTAKFLDNVKLKEWPNAYHLFNKSCVPIKYQGQRLPLGPSQ